jgi:hypothetical protein
MECHCVRKYNEKIRSRYRQNIASNATVRNSDNKLLHASSRYHTWTSPAGRSRWIYPLAYTDLSDKPEQVKQMETELQTWFISCLTQS